MTRFVSGGFGILALLATSALDAPAVAASVPAEICQRPSTASADLEQNKALVRSLFDILYGSSVKDIDRIDDLVAADYIQHNPSIGQGREGLRQLLLRIVSGPKEMDPKDTLSINLIAEGDFVVRQEMRTNGMLVDIFRVRDRKLQEHWDAFRFAPGAERIPGF